MAKRERERDQNGVSRMRNRTVTMKDDSYRHLLASSSGTSFEASQAVCFHLYTKCKYTSVYESQAPSSQ